MDPPSILSSDLSDLPGPLELAKQLTQVKSWLVSDKDGIAERQKELYHETKLVKDLYSKVLLPLIEGLSSSHFEDKHDEVLRVARVTNGYLGLMVNCCTNNGAIADEVLAIIIHSHTSLLEFVFDLSWCNFEENDEELNTEEAGELCLRTLLILVYNALKACNNINHSLVDPQEGQSNNLLI